ncbi:zinc finger protein 850 [Aedes albopictus]|uniref:C2H2-type domain-containing protein n=1 Tax=Aedes albopictus TaxID=7160 RepID=A0ABM1XQV7_AEDAL
MFISKRKKAARKSAKKRRLASLANDEAQTQLVSQQGSESSPLLLELEVEVEHDEDLPVEPMLVEEIKQEVPLDLGAELAEEVKVEPLEPEEEGPDPIGGQKQFDREPHVSNEAVYSLDTHCQFCLNRFDESGGRELISRRKAVFVLGLSKEKFTEVYPECCHFCKKQFDQSFEFKQSCLAALARSAEFREKTALYEIVDLKVLEVVNGAESFLGMESRGTTIEERSQELQGSIERPNNDGSSLTENGLSIKCRKCNEEFHEWSELEKHSYIHFPISSQEPVVDTRKKEYQHKVELYCFRCRKWYPTESIFTQHHPSCIEADRQRNKQKFYCFRCVRWFPSETLFVNHKPLCIAPVRQKDIPPNPVQDSTPLDLNNISPSIPASTQPCSVQSESITASKLHCKRCQKSFESKLLFKHHKPLCIESRVKKRSAFQCELCPQRCNSEKTLNLHMNRHKGIRSLPCRRTEGCTKMFLDVTIRRKHEEICGQDVLASICSICGATFRHRSNLQIHMTRHGEPKFPCEQCDKRFHSKAGLQKHSSVHSDARNYECKVCGKRFKSHEANRVHQRIHTQEKPYVCHICGTAFTYNCSLKAHLEKGHGTVEQTGRKEPVVAASNSVDSGSLWPQDGGY